MANVGGQKKKSVICKCRVLFGPTCWPQTEELVLFSKEGEFSPEKNLSSILAVSHVNSRLLTERWGAGSYVSTLSKDSRVRTLFLALQTEYANGLCSQTIKKQCLGQPVICNRPL